VQGGVEELEAIAHGRSQDLGTAARRRVEDNLSHQLAEDALIEHHRNFRLLAMGLPSAGKALAMAPPE
jgi:hypothetical protein